jgi:GxxExxY protein
MLMALAHEELTERIIGAAIEVHRQLGPGFIESIYERALIVEFQKCGLEANRQVRVPIVYDGVLVGRHKLDIFVNGLIVVELKTVKDFEDIHFAVVRSYLRAVGAEHGLLLNFAKPRLDIRRVIATS